MAHPFRERAAAAAASVFARVGAEAVYTPAGGGSPVTLRAVPRVEDLEALGGDFFAGRTLQTRRMIALLAADAGARPAAGATIAIGDETFTVTELAQSRDALSIVWLCPVGEPAVSP